MTAKIIFNKAIELIPGRTYVLEYEGLLPKSAKEYLIRNLEDKTQCKFVLLEDGIKIAKTENIT